MSGAARAAWPPGVHCASSAAPMVGRVEERLPLFTVPSRAVGRCIRRVDYTQSDKALGEELTANDDQKHRPQLIKAAYVEALQGGNDGERHEKQRHP